MWCHTYRSTACAVGCAEWVLVHHKRCTCRDINVSKLQPGQFLNFSSCIVIPPRGLGLAVLCEKIALLPSVCQSDYQGLRVLVTCQFLHIMCIYIALWRL